VSPVSTPALHTPLCDLLGVRHPIVQTGMGWVSSPELVIATSRAGGLGILAAATMTPGQVEDALRRIREQTDAPFGVGFLMGQPGQDRIVELLVQHRVRVASFNRNPQKEVVRRLQRGGVLCVPAIGAVKHARKVEQLGVDAVMVQGGEGGGHTGSVATSLLLPAVVDAVRIPVVAAGGYFDGRGLVAALAYGATGVAMGTRFLVTQESPVPMHVKQHYVGQPLESTVVTEHVDGLPQRVLRNAALERIERAHGLSAAQTPAAADAPALVRAALVDGDAEHGIMPTGQVVGLISDIPTVAELIERIVAEAAEILDRLCGKTAP
jgi:NAD(P)H-dependent flavin oxidoreductase YrpB (nitropropane dioxygenase family)